MTLEGLIMLVVWVLVGAVVAAALCWLVKTAPPLKDKPDVQAWLTWGIWGALVVILLLALVRWSGWSTAKLW